MSQAKDVLKSLKKRIIHKNPKVQLLALTVNMIRNPSCATELYFLKEQWFCANHTPPQTQPLQKLSPSVRISQQEEPALSIPDFPALRFVASYVYIRVSPFDISFGPSLKQLLSISVILYVCKLLIAVFGYISSVVNFDVVISPVLQEIQNARGIMDILSEMWMLWIRVQRGFKHKCHQAVSLWDFSTSCASIIQ
ncbi:hypothetical protein HU200_013358 [Digitaria exilis]|uniref:VHS domain-containing protein n=1 Tax=Digitaria exilis TaxID=1010633 RepID=A0A835FEP9_9POAL|nr:hypothetical protein HU200_013358 [Digitaria exilis]